jgi:hypothetical protein
MYYSDNGRFFDGDIHDAKDGLHKWGYERSRPLIQAAVKGRKTFCFTFVRNPYARVLSSFFDKIAGIQRNGKRYRGNQLNDLLAKYRVDVGAQENGFQFDQINSFRRFLLFARDTIKWKIPIRPDIHWSSSCGHISRFIRNGGHFDQIFFTENFDEGMRCVIENTSVRHAPDLETIPRFNESAGHGPKRLHPIKDYFDDLSRHLVWEMYKRDFQFFNYDIDDPSNTMPKGQIDVERIHAKLAK